MTKYQIGFMVVVLAVLAIFVIHPNLNKKDSEVVKNVEVLKSEKNMEVVGEEVAYFPGATGYFVRPSDMAFYPGVVMIHENRGLRPEIKMAAEQLAKEGYMVLAVDLFDGKVVESQEEAQALTKDFDLRVGVSNMRLAVDYLHNKGAVKVASLGWCFGGGQSLELALSGEKLDATVIYYGRLKTTEADLRPIKWPVLGIFGAEDQVVSTESVHEFEEALNDLGVQNEMHIYPAVGHAFANPSGMNYSPEATKAAWAETLAFLEENLK